LRQAAKECQTIKQWSVLTWSECFDIVAGLPK
jgi:hypothetical protein